ncbi:MAG: hypothetical protein ACPGLY_11815 [Rubripirellula sp.]
MDDPDYEVHPLDRDYSEVESVSRPRLKMPEGNVHRAGIFIFLTGFVTLLVTAGLLGIFRGSGPLETIGSYGHRLAMIMILGGGILILIGLRIRSMKLFKHRKGSGLTSRIAAVAILLAVNVVVLVVLYVAINLFRINLNQSSLIVYSVINTVFLALMAMVAVYHRGVMRGFAIGVLTAAFLGSNGFSEYSIYVYGGSRPSGAFFYLSQRLLTLQFCGMLCACYAAFAERKRDSSDESADS